MINFFSFDKNTNGSKIFLQKLGLQCCITRCTVHYEHNVFVYYPFFFKIISIDMLGLFLKLFFKDENFNLISIPLLVMYINRTFRNPYYSLF